MVSRLPSVIKKDMIRPSGGVIDLPARSGSGTSRPVEKLASQGNAQAQGTAAMHGGGGATQSLCRPAARIIQQTQAATIIEVICSCGNTIQIQCEMASQSAGLKGDAAEPLR